MSIYDAKFLEKLYSDHNNDKKLSVHIKKEIEKYNIHNILEISEDKIKELYEINSNILIINLIIIKILERQKLYHIQLIFISNLIKEYKNIHELKNFKKEIEKKYSEHFKFNNKLNDQLDKFIKENDHHKIYDNTIKINNIIELQKKYDDAKKNHNETLIIYLGIIAVKKFGDLYLNQLCQIFIEQNKINNALLILLFITYREPLSLNTLKQWSRISIELVSTKNYWISKIATKIYPNDINLLVNLSACCTGANAYSESKSALNKALIKKPDFYQAMINYANIIASEGEITEAVQILEKAKIIEKSKTSRIDSNLLFITQYEPNINYKKLYDRHIEFSNNIEILNSAIKFEKKSITKNNKIKVGVVSSDLINHPISYYMYKFIKYLNKDEFDIYIYNTFHRKDAVTKIFMDIVKSNWRDVALFNNNKIYEIIVKDNIDILFDLNGHTAGGKMELFATRCAQIQVAYVGYPFTTGLKNMDYRLTDEAYENDQSFNSEKLISVQDSHFSYQPLLARMDQIETELYKVKPSPALKNGYVTYGLSTNPSKLNNYVIEIFSKILIKVPNSKLLIEANGFNDLSFKKIFLEKFKNYGINENRLVLMQRDSRLQYIIYDLIDIALDPFPYNGGTSTLDLLWMGVPLVTLKGKVGMSREGAADLFKLNKIEGIALDLNEYVEKAASYAENLHNLNTERMCQRELFIKSSLYDGEKLGLNLGNTFKQLMKI
jgi:predicted O-linked N-acetylglucosamine transferase (SPINDLY family)